MDTFACLRHCLYHLHLASDAPYAISGGAHLDRCLDWFVCGGRAVGGVHPEYQFVLSTHHNGAFVGANLPVHPLSDERPA